MSEIMKYEAPISTINQKKLGLIAVIPGSLVSIGLLIWFAIVFFSNMEDVFNDTILEKFLYIAGVIMIPVFVFEWIRQIIDLWTGVFIAELHEDRIVGFTAWGKRLELKYSEIYKIEKRIRFYDMKLIGKDDKIKMVIICEINGYGACIEDIRKRCPNLQYVNYKGIDKKEKIWLSKTKEKDF
ncbi:MAG TPA: hypothetical protein PLQ69_10650 [Paludibacter sp.]|nr:hypothetical protein [Paludibacter sp.]